VADPRAIEEQLETIKALGERIRVLSVESKLIQCRRALNRLCFAHFGICPEAEPTDCMTYDGLRQEVWACFGGPNGGAK